MSDYNSRIEDEVKKYAKEDKKALADACKLLNGIRKTTLEQMALVEAIEKFLKENHEVLITHPTVIEGHDVLFLDFYTSNGKEHITTYTIAL